MENNEVVQDQNPLATDSVGKLILKYSLPAIASSLVSSFPVTGSSYSYVRAPAKQFSVFLHRNSIFYTLSARSRTADNTVSISFSDVNLDRLSRMVPCGIPMSFIRPGAQCSPVRQMMS